MPIRGEEGWIPGTVAQREMDMAGIALALIELRHEGKGMAGFRGDLLRRFLVDDMLIGGDQRLAIGEIDLVLSEIFSPLEISTWMPAASMALRIFRITGSTRAVPRME